MSLETIGSLLIYPDLVKQVSYTVGTGQSTDIKPSPSAPRRV